MGDFDGRPHDGDAELDQNERRRGQRDKKRRQRAAMADEKRQAARAADAERQRQRRAAMTEGEKAAARAKDAKRQQTARGQRPFLGVDGEGAGKNSYDQQNLVLLTCEGENFTSSLHKGIGDCGHISSVEAFEWILSLPAREEAILVGYFFNWDATQILRDIGPKVAEDLFRVGNYGPGGTRRWTHFNNRYAIKYIPRHLLAVARRGGVRNRALPETARYIHDVFGLFQSSFVNTAKLWQLADAAKLEAIGDMKNQRQEFTAVTPEMIDYSRDECRMLAQLMTRFREHSYNADIRPKSWEGGGPIARSLLERHRVPKRPLTAEERKLDNNRDKTARRPERHPEFEKATAYAYFAGRQEATRTGHIRGEIYRHDIHSAYPSKLLELPCQMHMRVIKSRSKIPPAEKLYLGWGHFRHPPDTIWGGLPVRGDNGGVCWPLEACGWWWSPEIRAAQQHLGMTIEFEEIWIIESPCQCDTFGFVRDLYEERRRLGAQTEGLPLKFGMNAIPGKLAQKVGTRPWYDLALAGLVNSLIRAQLIESIGAVGQRETVMLMTDCIYAKRPLPLPTGDGLGQFGTAESFNDLWIVKPGLHWPTENLLHAKTRGIPSSVIAKTHGAFEHAWRTWLNHGMPGDAPAVQIEFPVFVGLRVAACAMRDLKRAGRWETVRPKYGFGWRTKHDPDRYERHGDELWLWPLKGSIMIESRPYDAAALDDDRESGRDLMDAMPDYVPTLE